MNSVYNRLRFNDVEGELVSRRFVTANRELYAVISKTETEFHVAIVDFLTGSVLARSTTDSLRKAKLQAKDILIVNGVLFTAENKATSTQNIPNNVVNVATTVRI